MSVPLDMLTTASAVPRSYILRRRSIDQELEAPRARQQQQHWKTRRDVSLSPVNDRQNGIRLQAFLEERR